MTSYAIKHAGKYFAVVNNEPVWTPDLDAAVKFSAYTTANLVAMDPDGLNLVATAQNWEIVPVADPETVES